MTETATTNAQTLPRVWLDAADGRIGRALLDALCDAPKTNDMSSAQVLVLCRVLNSEDAQLVVDQTVTAGFSGPLILISALAERRYERWQTPEPADWSNEPWPDDDYGIGKRQARAVLEQAGIGPVCTLLLPALLTDGGPRAPWSTVLRQARADGHVQLPGDGIQLSGAVTVADVARVVARIVQSTLSSQVCESTAYQVGPREGTAVSSLYASFLSGAGLSVELRTQSDPDHRGALAPVDELCNASRLHAALPDMIWDDPRQACEQLGAALAARSALAAN